MSICLQQAMGTDCWY